MTLKKLFKYETIHTARGASLTELMVAIGILGAVATAGLSLSSVSSGISKVVQNKSQMQMISDRLREAAKNSTACMVAMGDTAASDAEGFTGVLLPDTDDSWKLGGTGREIEVYVPNLDAGTSGGKNIFTNATSGGANELKWAGLKIDSFRIQDAIAKCGEADLPACTDDEKEYVGRLVLQMSPISSSGGGIALKPIVVSGLVFTVDTTTNKLKYCRSSFARTEDQVCKGYGSNCVFDANITDGWPCVCPNEPDIGCPTPGQFMVSTVNGAMQCLEIGGGMCPKGEILTGVGLNSIQCVNPNAINVSFVGVASTVIKGNNKSITLHISEAQLQKTTIKMAVTGTGASVIGVSSPATLAGGVLTYELPAGQNDGAFTITTPAPDYTGSLTVKFTITSVSSLKAVEIGFPKEYTLTLEEPNCSHTTDYTWSSNNCNGTGTGSITKGTSVTIVDSNNADGYTGRATWSCSNSGVLSGPTGVQCYSDCTVPSPAIWVEGVNTCSQTPGGLPIAKGTFRDFSDNNTANTGTARATCSATGVLSWSLQDCNPPAPPPTCNCSTVTWNADTTAITWAAPNIPSGNACIEYHDTIVAGQDGVDYAYYCNNGVLVSFGNDAARNNTGHSCYNTAVTALKTSGTAMGSRTSISSTTFNYRNITCP